MRLSRPALMRFLENANLTQPNWAARRFSVRPLECVVRRKSNIARPDPGPGFQTQHSRYRAQSTSKVGNGSESRHFSMRDAVIVIPAASPLSTRTSECEGVFSLYTSRVTVQSGRPALINQLRTWKVLATSLTSQISRAVYGVGRICLLGSVFSSSRKLAG